MMSTKKTIFSQIMSLVSRYEFKKCVDRYKGDWHTQTFTCFDLFKVMSFAQFTDRLGLRDIEMILKFCGKGLYHAGLSTVPKSTLGEVMFSSNSCICTSRSFMVLLKMQSICNFGLQYVTTCYLSLQRKGSSFLKPFIQYLTLLGRFYSSKMISISYSITLKKLIMMNVRGLNMWKGPSSENLSGHYW